MLLAPPFSMQPADIPQPRAEPARINAVGMKMIWVDKGYYLAATTVTQTQWRVVMGNNPSHFQGGSRPVEKVSWNDCKAFCQRLTQLDLAAGKLPRGYVYTLPTEEQWEYACRAGTTGDYAGPLDQMAWHDANSGGRTREVAAKQPNAWGFHDMHGHVWEWCADTVDGACRANRGGGWSNRADDCRSGSRGWNFPDCRSSDLGFRPAVVSLR